MDSVRERMTLSFLKVIILLACGAPKGDLSQNRVNRVVGMITTVQTVSSDAIGWVLIDIEASVSVRSAQTL